MERLEETFWFLLKLTLLAVPFHLAITYLDLSLLQEMTAAATHSLLSMAGIPAELAGHTLRFEEFTLIVSRDSTGWKSISFLAALILASPREWREKIAGLAIFMPAVYSLNVLRVAVTSYAGFYGPEVFRLWHDYLWQAGLTAGVLFFWWIWLREGSRLADILSPGESGPV